MKKNKIFIIGAGDAAQKLLKEIESHNLNYEVAGFVDDDKNKIVAQLLESLSKRMMLRVYADLSDNQKRDLDILVKNNDSASIDEFLNKNILNIEKIRDEELRALIVATKKFVNA